MRVTPPRPARAAPLRPSVPTRATPTPTTASTTAVSDFGIFLTDAQQSFLTAVESLDGGAVFRRDAWTRPPSEPNPGHGVTAVLEGGALIEKGAASTTIVGGLLSPARAAALSARGVPSAVPGAPYRAAALSMVLHPANPHVPTLRGDVRAFECGGVAWFGGGCDLTPAYLYEGDATAFHGHWKGVCDRHGEGLYGELKVRRVGECVVGRKKARRLLFSLFFHPTHTHTHAPQPQAECDAYFYIPARAEHRGVGGIFFDGAPAPGAAGTTPLSPASALASVDGAAFAADVLAGWLPSWQPIVEARRGTPATAAEREWQLLRRGRYVEFNLVYDRGVRFGLDGGRVEAVMVSAPPLVRWGYNVRPEDGSREAALMEVLRAPRAWA